MNLYIIGDVLCVNELVGDKIKRLRKSLKISQNALAFGICDQSEISRIENNKFKPSFHVLKSVSDRLGVDVDFFLEHDQDRGDYVKDVKNELYKARRNRDYEEMDEIIKLESKNPLFQDGENRDFLGWNKGIVLYELSKKKDEAVEIMLSCLSEKNLDNLYKELDINILNSISIVYWWEKEPEKAKYYLEKAYNITNKLLDASNLRVNLKVMYTLSKIYTDLLEFENSLDLCKQGINLCRNKEDMFLFGEFHYQAGRNYLKLNDGEMGLEFMEKAKHLFEFAGDEGKGKIAKIIADEIKIYRKEGKVV